MEVFTHEGDDIFNMWGNHADKRGVDEIVRALRQGRTVSMLDTDALIAATAVQNGQTLVTANDKHYKFIPTLQINRFAP
jgi:predicted nucleic acid-binding protein